MGCGSSAPNDVSQSLQPSTKPAEISGQVDVQPWVRTSDGVDKRVFTSPPDEATSDALIEAEVTDIPKPGPMVHGEHNKHTADSPLLSPVKKKGVAFDICLDGNSVKPGGLISKHPPKTALKLEPLGVPKLTAEMLMEKQKLAEEKRARALERKKKKASSKASKCADIKQATEELSEQLKDELAENLRIAEVGRLAKQAEIIERQKLREERAKRVRQRAKKLNEDEDLPEIERDEGYNDTDHDSWLDGQRPDDVISVPGDRIYSGHKSPMKLVREQRNIRGFNSASTLDSCDNAFNNEVNNNDGFFD